MCSLNGVETELIFPSLLCFPVLHQGATVILFHQPQGYFQPFLLLPFILSTSTVHYPLCLKSILSLRIYPLAYYLSYTAFIC